MEASQSFVVAGAGGYLGSAFVRHLAAVPGASVIATARSSVAGRVSSEQVTYCDETDLTRPDDLARLACLTKTQFHGRFHVINATGLFSGYKEICEMGVDEAAEVLASNLMTTFGLAHSLIPLMAANGGGHFVAFSSHTACEAYPLMAMFTASKSAVDSLVKSIANEYARNGIIANSVALATLFSDEERRLKPLGDHAAWLRDRQVTEYVLELTQSHSTALNGNVLHLFNYSKSFFDQSYFERIRSVEDKK